MKLNISDTAEPAKQKENNRKAGKYRKKNQGGSVLRARVSSSSRQKRSHGDGDGGSGSVQGAVAGSKPSKQRRRWSVNYAESSGIEETKRNDRPGDSPSLVTKSLQNDSQYVHGEASCSAAENTSESKESRSQMNIVPSEENDGKLLMADRIESSHCDDPKHELKGDKAATVSVFNDEDAQEMKLKADSFSDLGLSSKVANLLIRSEQANGMGFEKPTEIQRLAIPQILAHRDVLLKSQTGSGKTLAFGLPILDRLQSKPSRICRTDGIYALILSPTRELCFQISTVLEKLTKSFYWIVTGALVGGEKRKSEKARIRKGVNILVGTPGRLMDHLNHTQTLGDSLKRGKLQWLVLDEADRLTDAGFIKQISTVLTWLEDNNCIDRNQSNGRQRFQTILVSATLGKAVQELASRSMVDPATIEATGLSQGNQESTESFNVDTNVEKDKAVSVQDDDFNIPKTLSQHFVFVESRTRLVALSAFILRQVKRCHHQVKIILFVSSRAVVNFLYELLSKLEWPPTQNIEKKIESSLKSQNVGLCTRWWKLHGSMDQQERRKTVFEFAKAKGGVLICTDVAARGLDLPFVDWVVQYDPPSDVADYVHRVGRTARSGKSGSSLLFLAPFEKDYVQLLRDRSTKLVEIGSNRLFGVLSKYCVLVDEAKEAEKELDELVGETANIKARTTESVAEKPSSRIFQRARSDPDAAVALMQAVIRDLVEGVDSSKTSRKGEEADQYKGEERSKLKIMAEEAFLSFVRAYAVHSKETKHIFHPKNLHLGHVAKAFGLKEPPTTISTSARGRLKERMKRKQYFSDKKVFNRAAERLVRKGYNKSSEFT